MSTYVLHVDKGEEVMEKLTELIKASPIQSGCSGLVLLAPGVGVARLTSANSRRWQVWFG